jgi:hypothetical protein
MLQSSSEVHRCELYQSSETGSFEFAGSINHSLLVHKAEDVTAGVDSALEQLRSNMAAISEFKEANKYDDDDDDNGMLCTRGLTKIAAGPLSAMQLLAARRPIAASRRRASRRRTSLLPCWARRC